MTISNNINNFEIPLFSTLKSRLNKLTLFDIDNNSDHLTINAAKQAMDKANKMVVVFNIIDNHAELGKLISLFNNFYNYSKSRPFLALMNGNHPMIDKLILRFKKSATYADDRAVISKAVDFFSKS